MVETDKKFNESYEVAENDKHLSLLPSIDDILASKLRTSEQKFNSEQKQHTEAEDLKHVVDAEDD